MNGYLLDTNHLSAYLDRRPLLKSRITSGLMAGNRFGICLPVLCEYRAGVAMSRRRASNFARLEASPKYLRQWPCDRETTVLFGRLSAELRSIGRVLAQFDLLIAAVAMQHGLTLLTADADFEPVVGLERENWL